MGIVTVSGGLAALYSLTRWREAPPVLPLLTTTILFARSGGFSQQAASLAVDARNSLIFGVLFLVVSVACNTLFIRSRKAAGVKVETDLSLWDADADRPLATKGPL